MRCWHICSEKVFNIFYENKILNCSKNNKELLFYDKKEKIIYDNIKNAYDYMTKCLEEYCPKDEYAKDYPIWLWYKFSNKEHIPHLRKGSTYFSKEDTTPSVRIELSIPDDRVLLSDFSDWHFVLNGSKYCNNSWENDIINSGCRYPNIKGTDEKYYKTFTGLDNSFIRNKYNWGTIFNIYKIKCPNWHGSKVNSNISKLWYRQIQGVTWYVRYEWVRKVTFFDTRITKVKVY